MVKFCAFKFNPQDPFKPTDINRVYKSIMHILAVSKAFLEIEENSSIVIISLSFSLKLAKAAAQMTISQFRKCSAVPPK